jgi:lysophospholipase L1-like esterase
VSRDFVRSVVVSGALALMVGGFCVTTFTMAESGSSVDWFTNDPTLKQSIDYITAPTFANDDCKKSTIRVSRGVSSAFEEHCMLQTSNGLVDTNGSQVIQPAGYTTAYAINVQAGSTVVLPIPNQGKAMYMHGYSAGPGVVLGLYNNLLSRLKLKTESTGTYYTMSGADTTPDSVFHYPNNEPMRFGTMSFSSNGRYMMADTIFNGFVRIDLDNPTAIQPFADSTLVNSGGLPLPAETRISDDGQIAAIAYNSPGDWGDRYFKIVDINSCTNALPQSTSQKIPIACKTRDIFPKLKQLLPTIDMVGTVRFANDHTITFVARYKNAAGQYRYADYAMTANGWPTSIKQYLALGDSYISGEGAMNYRDGTDTADNQCHQSLVSYPYLLSDNFISSASVACSGARMHNVDSTLTYGQSAYQVMAPPNDGVVNNAMHAHSPGYKSQDAFVAADNPEAVTISIGGNDIGFGDILEKCVHPTKYLADNLETASTCYDTYEDRAEVVNLINDQFTKLRSLYKNLKGSENSTRRVYVIGYPQIAKVGGDCGLNVQMNADEVAFGHELISYLDSVIKLAADQAGVQYVDTEHAFDGHRLCEAQSGQAAVNGFTISKTPTGGYDFKASFHPNQRGHQLLADVIRTQTANLTKPMPTPVAQTNEIILNPSLSIFQTVPKTNRPLRYVRIVDDIGSKIIKRASPTNILVDGHEYLTKANIAFNVVINSQPVSLGNFVTDSDGSLSINPVIPSNVPVGFHTIHIYGLDIFGNPIDIQQVIYIAANDDDKDGDNIKDVVDNCVFVAQSGTDIDQDNIDDACDPLIAEAPASDQGQDPEGIVWFSNAIVPITIQTTSGQ